MCVQPVTLLNGTVVRCCKCWSCRANRQKMWVGKALAERETAAFTSAVTLTYRTDHPNSDVLVYEDLRRYIRALRKRHSVRYLVAGEYGSKKGRAHWHAILFWRDGPPSFLAGEELYGEVMRGGEAYPERKNFAERHWPHGFSYWAPAHEKDISYACKYLLKSVDDENADRRFGFSSGPPLGAEFVKRLAARWAAAGLTPARPVYTIEGVRKNGRPVEFQLSGYLLERFAEELVRAHAAYGRHPGATAGLIREHDIQGGLAVRGQDREWLSDTLDKIASGRRSAADDWDRSFAELRRVEDARRQHRAKARECGGRQQED